MAAAATTSTAPSAESSEKTTKAFLSRAHSPDTVDRIFSDKIQYRTLYLRPNSPPPSSNARYTRRRAREEKKRKHQKLRPKPLSSRQRRALGLHNVPRKGQKYELFAPLYRLWLGYIREILGSTELENGGQNASSKLAAAEFHGAEVLVARSVCPSRVGIRGIIIKDAKFVFEIITRKNEIKIVPKEGTMFRIEVPLDDDGNDGNEKQSSEQKKDAEETEMAGDNSTPKANTGTATLPNEPRRCFVFEIMGDQFLQRGADRANKKYKAHFLKDV